MCDFVNVTQCDKIKTIHYSEFSGSLKTDLCQNKGKDLN